MKIIAKKICNEIFKLGKGITMVVDYEGAGEIINKSKESLGYLEKLEVGKKPEIGYE